MCNETSVVEISKTEKPLSLDLQIMRVQKGETIEHILAHTIRLGNVGDGGSVIGALSKDQSLPHPFCHMFDLWYPSKLKPDGEFSSDYALYVANEGATKNVKLIWPVRPGMAYVVPFAVRIGKSVLVTPDDNIFSDILSVYKQNKILILHTTFSHHDHLGKCQQCILTPNLYGHASGVLKPHRRRRCETKDTPEIESRVKSTMLALGIAKRLVFWFREFRHDHLLIKVALCQRMSTRQRAAQEWLHDMIHSPTPAICHLFRQFIHCNPQDVQQVDEFLKEICTILRSKIADAAKRLLTAFKHQWRNSDNVTNTPPMDWSVYKPYFDKTHRQIVLHADTIPYYREVRGDIEVNWSDLVNIYSNYGSGSLEKNCDGDTSDTINQIGRVIPHGKWERALHLPESAVVAADPKHLEDYDIISFHPKVYIRLQDLDEVRRSKGQHLEEASQTDLTGDMFRVEGREGKAGMYLSIPNSERFGEYTECLVRMWNHLHLISTEDALAMASWSPIYARRKGIINSGKQHTSEEKHKVPTRTGIGQPRLYQSKTLMGATGIQFLHALEDEVSPECTHVYDVANQLRIVYALMGIIVNFNSHYAKRRLAKGDVKDHIIPHRGGIGSLVSRRKRGQTVNRCNKVINGSIQKPNNLRRR